MNDSTIEKPNFRNAPQQARAEARVETLLDAAAQLIGFSNSPKVAPDAVTKLAGASTGVFYRYFKNADMLHAALGARNLGRYSLAVAAKLPAKSADWKKTADIGIDEYVRMMRAEPGFRAVRFGGIQDGYYAPDSSKSEPSVAAAIVDLLIQKYGFQKDDQLVFAIQVSVQVASSLIELAFLLNPHGDERFIKKARALVCTEISEVAPSS